MKSSKYYKWMPEKGRAKFLNEMIWKNNFKIGAEIGTGNGILAKQLLIANPNLCLVQVGYYPRINEMENTSYKVRKKWLEVMNFYSDRVIVIEKPSNQAVKQIKDGSLDFVFIDANHSYKSVLEDIQIWYPKVRKDGMVSGHDYDISRKRLHGVIRAVREYFKKDFQVDIDCVWYHFKKTE